MSPAILLAILAATAPGADARYAAPAAASVQVSAEGRPLVLAEQGAETTTNDGMEATTVATTTEDLGTTTAEVLNASEGNVPETGSLTEPDVLSMASQEEDGTTTDQDKPTDLLDDGEEAGSTTAAEVLSASDANVTESGMDEPDVLTYQDDTTDAPTELAQGDDTTDAPTELVQGDDTTDAPTELLQGDDTTDAPTELLQGDDTTDAPTELLQGDDTTDAPTELLQGDDSTTDAPTELLQGDDTTTDAPTDLVQGDDTEEPPAEEPSEFVRAKHGKRAKKLAAQGDDSDMEEIKSKVKPAMKAKKTKMIEEASNEKLTLKTKIEDKPAARSASVARKLAAITSALIKANDIITLAQNMSSHAQTMIGEDLYLGQDIVNAKHAAGGLNSALFQHGADMVPNQNRLELKAREIEVALNAFKGHYNDIMPPGRSVTIGA